MQAVFPAIVDVTTELRGAKELSSETGAGDSLPVSGGEFAGGSPKVRFLARTLVQQVAL